MYKVVSSSPTFGKYSKKPIKALESEGCTVIILDGEVANDEEKLADAISDADALIVGVEKITKKVLNEAQKLKVIAKHGAGVDNIDLMATGEKGIPVAFAPGANRHAVADLAFGLILSLARKIPNSYLSLSEGSWPRVVGVELYEKTLGVVGAGRIGKEVIRRARGFDMKILAFDPYQDAELIHYGVDYVELDKLLSESDFISIHTNLNEQSRGLFDRDTFKKMKNSSFLVNTSRGEIIDEKALYEALNDGEIAGAALDVFEVEPAGSSPLLSLPNFIGTPHMAGYTVEALEEVGMITSRNVVNVLKGEKAEYEWKVPV